MHAEKLKGMKEKGNGNPLIRKHENNSSKCRDTEAQQKDVTDDYCEHGSILHEHPRVC